MIFKYFWTKHWKIALLVGGCTPGNIGCSERTSKCVNICLRLYNSICSLNIRRGVHRYAEAVFGRTSLCFSWGVSLALAAQQATSETGYGSRISVHDYIHKVNRMTVSCLNEYSFEADLQHNLTSAVCNSIRHNLSLKPHYSQVFISCLTYPDQRRCFLKYSAESGQFLFIDLGHGGVRSNGVQTFTEQHKPYNLSGDDGHAIRIEVNYWKQSTPWTTVWST